MYTQHVQGLYTQSVIMVDLDFILQALSAKGWSPKGRRGKMNTSPVQQQMGDNSNML